MLHKGLPCRRITQAERARSLTCRNEAGRESGDTIRMWPYHPELLATPVPRYTSFPTAAEFGAGIGASDLRAAIEQTTGDVSLYIHIPFCKDICWYCGCNTGRANHAPRLAGYLDALHREIALISRLLPTAARVRRVALGGGSPNAMSPTDFVRLMMALIQSFGMVAPDVSIELDPRSLESAWGKALAGVGVRRASLGVQTFASHLQQAIGRVQPLELIQQSVELLRTAGVTSLNFDLMYGLPGQTQTDLRETLEQAAALGADRIALFGYAHVPDIMPRQHRIDASALPDQAARFAMAASGHAWLMKAGYMAAGFDHFALPGDPLAQAALSRRLHRNFQGFTDDGAPTLIGMGASAISSFPDLIVQNEKNAGRYGMLLSQDCLTGVRGHRRSADDRARGKIIERLLCDGQAPVDGYVTAEVAGRLEPFVARNLARIEDSCLFIGLGGLPYARSIASVFDPYRKVPGRQFSSAV